MSRRSTSALPDDSIDVELIEIDTLEGMRVRLPRQDRRYDPSAELPRLVLVRSSDYGHAEIAGTGWWGNQQMNPEMVAVEASPALVRTMARPRDPSFNNRFKPATLTRARAWDIAIYARGFWTPTFVAALVAAGAITCAVVGFLKDNTPLRIAGPVIALIACAELGKALGKIVGAARRII